MIRHPSKDPDHCTYIRNMESMVKAGQESIPHIFNKKTSRWWRRYLRGLLAWVREERTRIDSEETEWPIVEGITLGFRPVCFILLCMQICLFYWTDNIIYSYFLLICTLGLRFANPYKERGTDISEARIRHIHKQSETKQDKLDARYVLVGFHFMLVFYYSSKGYFSRCR